MLGERALTRLRFPLVSDHGSTAPDYYATPTSTLPFLGSVQPVRGELDVMNRDAASDPRDVWCDDPGLDVQDADMVLVDGARYSVVGVPERWLTGVLDHTLLHLVRWRG